VVFGARQLRLKRLVALKVVRDADLADAEHFGRFLAEPEAVARLQHPNIVQIHDVGEHRGRPYFALEYVEGGSLARRLSAGPLMAGAAAELVETLARAMHYAHGCGVVHRDLKPANILLQRTDEESRGRLSAVLCPVSSVFSPKITDFGLAKLLG